MEIDRVVTAEDAGSRGMSAKTKVIIAVQVVLALAIVAVTIRLLLPPEPKVTLPPASVPSGNASTASGPGSSSSAQSSIASNSKEGIPQKLGAVTLTDALTGRAAIEDMSALHGKSVGVTGGWVGHYQARGTVWVGETADEKTSMQLLQAMIERIGVSKGPFSGLKDTTIDNQKLYFVTGLGQNHYFYRKSNKVIWLALPNNKPDDFLRDALSLIK